MSLRDAPRLINISAGLAGLFVSFAATVRLAQAQSETYIASGLAEAAYPKKQGILDRNILRRFPRRGARIIHSNGVSAGIFDGQQVIYVAFAGTDQIIDVLSDSQLAAWFGKNKQLIRGQIATAKGVAQSAIARNPQNKRIVVVGHSLGGYLAQVVTAELKMTRGISFNAPGFGPKDKGAMFNPRNKSSIMVNHSRERDAVGNYGVHFGKKVLYHDVLSVVNHPGNNHGITGFRKDLARGLESSRALVSGKSHFSDKAIQSQPNDHERHHLSARLSSLFMRRDDPPGLRRRHDREGKPASNFRC
ncbi:MAG: hypothetical protein O3A84_14385 [Proteobacteria bacterium]|nr:hypothetical protein [Pseudomonadota bacterium]